MYVRLRKNVTGSTSVLLIASKRIEGKKHPQAIVIKSFGSTFDKEKLKKLVKEATTYKANHAVTTNLGNSNKKHHYICTEQIDSCKVCTIGFRYFYGSIFDKYFYTALPKKINKQTLKDLSILRIGAPASKLNTSKQANNLGVFGLTLNKIYKFMDTLDDAAIEKLKQCVYRNTKALLGSEDLNVLFYDLTTIYFETNTSGDLREFGFSKDGKHQHVQISLALIVTNHGLPVGYEIFKGNVYEGHTLLPTLNKLRERYKIKTVSIVADSAMMSAANLQQLEQDNFGYVVAAKVRNLNKAATAQVLDRDCYNTLSDDISYRMITVKDQTLIACHSKSRQRKDENDRVMSIKRAEKYIGSSVKGKLTGALKKSYISLSHNSQIMLDQVKLEESKKLDGYFGFYTNLKGIDPGSILKQYKGLWQIEQTFRITKHNLAIRPVYHWKDRRIKAHFAICFIALALVRTAEYVSTLSKVYTPIEALHAMLKEVKLVKIIHAGKTLNVMSDIPDALCTACAALNIQMSRVPKLN